ncbi:TolC family outer membrane protein [Thiomicrorhabdus sp. Milos-T2]|uniref:TolC family outer membrane protein n=1 Tax=Thiomicrorhabdus sp. Milos-T2 TaxID=90814 RepID=UPI00068BD467|nr:TolC family outer membrane protein [Thiomicrorhabdus sp. Milos-T2]
MGALSDRKGLFGVGILIFTLMTSVSRADGLLDLYQVALDADPELKKATFDHQATSEVVPQAWAGYLPTVSLDYDTVTTTQDIVSSDNTVFQKGSTSFPSNTLTLTLTQPVFRYANYLRIGQAKEELKQADAELIQAQQDLMLRVSEAYFNALMAEDTLTFLEAEKTTAAKQLDLAIGREESSLGRAVDRYDAEARLATVEADYAEAELDLKNAYDVLYEVTGKEPKELARLVDEIKLESPTPGNDQFWIDSAMNKNPAVVVQRHSVEVSRMEIDRQNAGHYPTVDLIYRVTKQETQGTLFGGGSDVQTQEGMLRLNVPIYAGGSVSSKKREAVAKSSSSKSELTRLLRVSRSDSRKAFWGVVNSVTRVKALEKAVVSQAATLDLRQAAYESGIETTMNVLDAERDYYSAKRDLSQAKYDYLLNGLRLKALVGILTQEDIITVNSWLTN